ncbi:Prophage LambdaBa04, site-specific recombinase, phage integrase family protein [Bacillus sp. 349Y]|nr:Prophage LambdaBa04, site-specific recombinase, phage integrase family protein [Bacillus sp. 349Y]
MKGSIRKRGNKYSYTVDIGRDPVTGKRQQKTKSGFKTKKEAQAALAKMINEVESGTYREKTKTTLLNFADDFFETQVKPNLRKATQYNYVRTMKLLEEHKIGHCDLSEVNAMHVQSFFKHLQDKGYGNGTIKVFLANLKTMLNKAFEWGLIGHNPALIKTPKAKKKADQAWTYETAMDFLEKVKDDSHYLIYLLTLFTGLRRGEVLGIPEKNVDFNNEVIHITQQVAVVNGKAELTKDLKTSSSYRTIEVPSFVLQEIRNHIKEQKKRFLAAGIPNKYGLLFITSNGGYIHPNNLNLYFRRAIEKYDMPRIPFHGLRHTHATILSEMGTNVHAISNRLGHSSPVITNEMYIHLSNKMNKQLLDHLDTMGSILDKKKSDVSKM